MAVGELELADAGVVAAEFAVPRADQIEWPLAQVKRRLTRKAGEIAREVAVVNRSVPP